MKLAILMFIFLISIPYLFQKFMPPKADEKGYQIEKQRKYYGQIYPGIYGEIEPPDETTTRERLRKKQE